MKSTMKILDRAETVKKLEYKENTNQQLLNKPKVNYSP